MLAQPVVEDAPDEGVVVDGAAVLAGELDEPEADEDSEDAPEDPLDEPAVAGVEAEPEERESVR